MSFVISIIAGVFGLFIGSFLNVLADRLSNEENPFKGRSHCDSCGETLGPQNIIPVFSYIFQKGKCAFCGKKLSAYYPISELITALTFGVITYFSIFSYSPTLLNTLRLGYFLAVSSVYIVIILSDAKYQIIPNEVVYSGILLVFFHLIASSIYHSYDLKYVVCTLLTGLGIMAFFYALVVFTKEKGMGGGDVKLGLMIGLLNGFPYGIVALFLSFILGSIISLALIAVSKKGLKDVIPFGPFLILGSVLSLLYGDWIISRYFSL